MRTIIITRVYVIVGHSNRTFFCQSREQREDGRGGGVGGGVEEELRVVFPFLVVLSLGLRRDMDRAVNGIECVREEERER